jgi:7-keto-8-aminopelargonate synthetase-like enzyme
MLTFQFWKMLFDEGIFTNPASRQAVAPDAALLRTSVIATHTPEQLDRALDAFWQVGRALKVI